MSDDDARRDAQLLARFQRLGAMALGLLVLVELLAGVGIVAEPIGNIFRPFAFGQFFAMALLGTFVLHLWCGPPRREALVALGLGVAGELLRVIVCVRAGWEPRAIVLGSGLGAGLGGLAAQAWFAGRSRGVAQRRRLVVLLACLLVAIFVLLSNPFVFITGPLHPLVLDGLVYAFDDSLGFQPSFAMARLFRAWPRLDQACQVVYLATPFGFALVWAAQRRARRPAPIDVMSAFLLASTAGFGLYHAFPVVGPTFFMGNGFPDVAPAVATLGLEPRLAMPVARNCIPSLHTTWVLLLWWHSRGQGAWVRALAGLFVTMTLMATLGLGLHYLGDLMVAVPFAAGAQAASAPATAARRRTLMGAALLVALWLIALRTGMLVRTPRAWLSWGLGLGTVGLGLWLERTLWKASAAAVREGTAAEEQAPIDWRARGLAASFAVTAAATVVGLAGAWRALALGFGGGARTTGVAAATVLLGLGAGLAGGARVAARRRDPLRLYAAGAGASGLFWAASPALCHGVGVAAARLGGGGGGGVGGVALELLLATLLLAPPALLLGAMVAPLARVLDGGGRALVTLLAAGALGAAAGALATGDLLWPALGTTAPAWIAAALGLGVALAALRSDRGPPAPAADEPRADRDPTPTPAPAATARVAVVIVPLAAAAALTTAAAVLYAHLGLAVIGDSSYAAAAMLACAFAGLGAGALATRRAVAAGVPATTLLPLAAALAAAGVLAGVQLWSALSGYFASFESYPVTRTFGAREVVRLCVCLVAIVPPAAALGALLAAALGRARTASPAVALAAVAAAAGLGLAAPLPAAVGSLHALQLWSLAALALALVTLLRGPRRLSVAPVLAAAALLAVLQPRDFDWARLGAGAHVFFATNRAVAAVADHAESLAGGVTLVAVNGGVRTLVHDGHAAGDDSPARNLAAEQARAALPLLHARATGRALVIGAGTGHAAAALAAAGFARVEVVDDSADLLRLGAAAFGQLAAPAIATHAADGRAFLAARRGAAYDLITVGAADPWTLAAAPRYSREGFAVAAAALGGRGVLAQWLPLARLSALELACALAAAHAVFPHVWLYVIHDSATLIACAESCAPEPATLARLDAAAALQPVLAALGGHATDVSALRLLDTGGVERLLAGAAAGFGRTPDELAVSDEAAFFETHAPAAVARSPLPTLQRNLAWLASFATL